MCQCKGLPGVVGNADTMRLKLRDGLRLQACDRDLYLWQCQECGALWEAVPCSPYWCLGRDARAEAGWSDLNPRHNNGYVYQKTEYTLTDWLARAKTRNRMRQSRLLEAVRAYRQEGYTFVDSGGEDGLWVEFDRTLPENDGIERLLVGIDYVGRRYYEKRTIIGSRTAEIKRAGEDAGGPWLMG